MHTDRIPVDFYRTTNGAEPVRDWLRSLAMPDRRTIGGDLLRVQEQWPVGMPVCRSLGNGLWETRSSVASNRIARVVFFFYGGKLVVLHGFIKKSRKMPAAELELARRRMKEVVR